MLMLILLSIVANADTSDASFNWQDVSIPGTQLDYGEGSGILWPVDTSGCYGAGAVVAVVKQTEFILSKQASDTVFVSYGDPLYCKSRFSAAGHVATNGCSNDDSKNFLQVYNYFTNDGILARVWDEHNYDGPVLLQETPTCASEESSYTHSDYARTPTPRFQVVNFRQSSVADFKTALLAAPLIAYVHNDIRYAAQTGTSVFAPSAYSYNPGNPNDMNSLTAVLIIGWGMSGDLLFWHALTPWGATAGSYGVISLTQGDTMNIGFFRYIGAAAAGSDNNNNNQNSANNVVDDVPSTNNDSGLSDAAIAGIVCSAGALLIIGGLVYYNKKTATVVMEDVKVHQLPSRKSQFVNGDNELALTRMGSTEVAIDV